jgi:Peptidase C39 family
MEVIRISQSVQNLTNERDQLQYNGLYLTDEEILEIANRACGLCCAVSAIAAVTGERNSVLNLYYQIAASGGFTAKGIIHQALAKCINQFGVAATAKQLDSDQILANLGNKLYICSITHKFPLHGSGGHLVLAHQFDSGQMTVHFMDPSGWGENNRALVDSRFFASYSGRCIEIERKISNQLLASPQQSDSGIQICR